MNQDIYTQRVLAYYYNEMNSQEKMQFEADLTTDALLQKEWQILKETLSNIDQASAKPSAASLTAVATYARQQKLQENH
jgi:hypothetical protein